MLRRPTTSDYQPKGLAYKRTLRQMLTPEHMTIAVQRETARADRNGAQFALVLFRTRNKDLQSLSNIRLAKIVLHRVRATDDVGWFDERHLAVLLPDTAPSGAWRFADQVCTLIAAKGTRPLCSVYSYPTLWFRGETDRSAETARDAAGEAVGVAAAIAGDGIAAQDGSRGIGYAINGIGNGSSAGDRYAELSARAANRVGIENIKPVSPENLSQPEETRTTPVVHPVESLLLKPLPWWKRGIDILGASLGMVMLSPIMGSAALLVRVGSTGPVIFSQNRAGLGGKPFKIFKFRTMCVDAEAKQAELRKISEQDGPAFKLKNDPRVTRIGKILRKTSIDELPQLLNVLKGDMTLVGPRPLPISESEACEGWHRRRLDVTPGLTCIWQVKGRSQVSFSDWVRMDVAYIRRRTLLNDIRILLATVPAVLLRKGAR